MFLNCQFLHIDTASNTFSLNQLSMMTFDLGLPKHRGFHVLN